MEETMIIGLIILTSIIWSWAIIDLFRFRSRLQDSRMTATWLLVILCFPIVGSILYFQLKNRSFTSKPRRFNPSFNKVKSR